VPPASRAARQLRNPPAALAAPSRSLRLHARCALAHCYSALAPAAPWRQLRGEIGLHDGLATRISVDNLPSKTVLQGEHSEMSSTGVQHIDRRVLGVKQQIAAGIYGLDWTSSTNNPADIGATFKYKVEFTFLRAMIMGYEFHHSMCVSRSTVE
jgi:hypothetical protein